MYSAYIVKATSGNALSANNQKHASCALREVARWFGDNCLVKYLFSTSHVHIYDVTTQVTRCSLSDTIACVHELSKLPSSLDSVLN